MAKDSIDTLELKIVGSAQGANKAINALVKNLGTLSTALSNLNIDGVDRFSRSIANFAPAMKDIGSIDSRKFKTLIRNIKEFDNINSVGLEKSARAITSISSSIANLGNVAQGTEQVKSLSGAIAKLGYKSVTNAVTNIPKLARALKDFMATMSTAPKVSANAIRMTEAIGRLADSLKGVRTSTQRTSTSLRGFHNSFKGIDKRIARVTDRLKLFKKNTDNANKSSKGLVSTIGLLYAKFWILGRAISGLGASIKSAMDYIEVLNYFDKSFEQVASNAVSQWKEAGYESAQAYYESFSKRAKILTAKMTGFQVDDSGMLQATGATSLGINPTSIMNYQAMFAQMSSSMGVASENALALSNALTQIGADLASVRNMEFEEVWQDLASGLVGMSRTLDKYGVNIRDTNMQQKLTELGIDETVKALNQQDKALLRTIILLESTKYAWGDLSETLNQPANQLRMLTANIRMLCQMVGSLFVPLVASLLPYLNGLVIALQRFVTWVAKALGISVDLSQITSTGGKTSDVFSELLDQAEEFDTSLDDAVDSAKEIKSNLLGIDELNVVTEDKDTKVDLEMPNYSDILNDAFWDALKEYQNAWDDAFKQTENNAQKIADAIIDKFKFAIEPITIAWDSEGDHVIAGWKRALEEIRKLISDIGRDFSRVWHSDETIEILKDIFHIIGNIGYVVANLANGFREAWNYNENGYRILCNIRDIIGAIVENIKNASEKTIEWAENLNFIPLLSAIERFTRKLAERMSDISGIFTDFYEIVVLGVLKHLAEVSIPNLIDVFTRFIDKVDWEKLRSNFKKLWEALEHLAEIIADALIIVLGDLLDAIAEFVNGAVFQKLIDMFTDWIQSLTAEDIAKLLENIFKAFLLFKGLTFLTRITFAIDGFVKAIKGLELVKGIGSIAKSIGKGLKSLGGSKTPNIGDAMMGGTEVSAPLPMNLETFGASGGLLATIGKIAKAIGGITLTVGGAVTAISNFWTMLQEGFNWVNEALMLVGIAGAGIGAVILGANPIVAGAIGIIVATIGTAVPLIKEHWDDIKTFFGDLWENIKTGVGEGWTKIKESLSGWWDNIVQSTSDSWDGFVSFFDGIWEGIKINVGTWWSGIKDSLSEWWNSIKEGANETWTGFTDFFSGIWDGIKTNAEEQWILIKEKLSNSWGEIKTSASSIWGGIKQFFGGVWDGIESTAKTLWDGVKGFLETTWGNIKDTASETWGNIKTSISDCWNDVKTNVLPIVKEVKDDVVDKWDEIKRTAIGFSEDIKREVKSKWEETKGNVLEVIDKLKTESISKWDSLKHDTGVAIDKIKADVKDKWEEIKGKIVDTIEQAKTEGNSKWDELKTETIKKFGEIESEVVKKWDGFKKKIGDTIVEVKNDAIEKWENFKKDTVDLFEKIKTESGDKWSEIKSTVGDKVSGIKKDFDSFVDDFNKTKNTWLDNFNERVSEKFKDVKDAILDKWEEVKKGSSDFFGRFDTDLVGWARGMVDSFKSGCGDFSSKLEPVFDGVKRVAQNALEQVSNFARDIWDKVKSINSAQGSISSSRYSYSSFPMFASGGFPEDGFFFANHTELVGKFSNGRTAVANNEQIVAGIAQGVYKAMVQANSENTRQESLLEELIVAVKEGKSISIDGRDIVTAYDSRKSRNGFAF